LTQRVDDRQKQATTFRESILDVRRISAKVSASYQTIVFHIA
jgi:hypothetical protein